MVEHMLRSSMCFLWGKGKRLTQNQIQGKSGLQFAKDTLTPGDGCSGDC